MRDPGGEFEVPFDEAVFGGPARNESRHYWIQGEGPPGRSCIVPHPNHRLTQCHSCLTLFALRKKIAALPTGDFYGNWARTVLGEK